MNIFGNKYPMIITNTTLGIVVYFVPNPQHIRFESRKILSQTQTLEGFIFEHWGEAPAVIRVRGMTVCMQDARGEAAAEAFLFALRQLYRVDKKRVAALTSLVKQGAQTLYNKVKGTASSTASDFTQLSDSFIYYRTDAYRGFFTNFEFEQRGELPNVYQYQFDYLVTSTAQNFLADLMFTPSTSAISSSLRAAAGAVAVTGAGALPLVLVDGNRVG